jgi:pyrroloquinoline-quinone synthase
MDIAEFKEALVRLMEGKRHWAWSLFTSGQVAADRLHVHFEQEYATYVRDFAILLGRAYVQCPVAEIRAELAENLYEEETGKLSLGKPHAELFLCYPAGLGMDVERFKTVTMLHEAARFRAYVDEATLECGWETAMVVATIFLEGNEYERSALEEGAKRPEVDLSEHPLVKHYGLDESSLALTRAHRMVEAGHRQVAWSMVDAIDPSVYPQIISSMEEIIGRWYTYRDAVARACGLVRPVAS